MSLFGELVDFSIDLIPRQLQEKLGRRLLDRARGEGNHDLRTNGEFYFLDHVKRYFHEPDTCFFDVGANVGEWSERALRGMHEQFQLYAFEPAKRTNQALERKLSRLFANAQFSVEALALSDANSQAVLHLTGELNGTNSLHGELRHAKSLGLTECASETVQLQRGDEFCRSRGITEIHFLKIDTEGHEAAVLRGFSEMFKTQKIHVVQFEYGGCWIDSRSFLYDVFDQLGPCGYRFGKLHPRHVEVLAGHNQRLENFSFANYVAVLERHSALLI